MNASGVLGVYAPCIAQQVAQQLRDAGYQNVRVQDAVKVVATVPVPADAKVHVTTGPQGFSIGCRIQDLR